MDNKIGILDPEGQNNNPLTNNTYSETYLKWAKIWSKYPAYEKAEEMIEQIKNNQVLLVISGTGTGKTVLTPKYVLHALDYKGKVAITLPKQIIAKSAAEFAALTLDVKLGEEVGYQYKGAEGSAKSNKTKLLYATDGTIVARLMNDPKLMDFDAVVIDEAHERKVQIDFLLYLLRNTLKLRPEFKLIIMSATINADIFKSYFSTFKMATTDIATKSNYPIESIFLPSPLDPKEYMDKGYEILKEIVKKDDPLKPGAHDILFFVTSINESIDICERINKDNLDGYCVEVYSGMDSTKEEIAKDRDLYKNKSQKARKIVIATPVAESSLTIDGLKYVIDSGYELSGYYNPEIDARVLEKKLITHAQAKQRMGRAGRTEPGITYHLYTKEQFESMRKFPEPSIRTSNIYGECLKLMQELKTTEKLLSTLTNFIEPPRELYLRNSIVQLRNLNLITNDGITELGNIIADLQVDPMAGLAMYAGKKLRCSYEIMKIMCVLDASKGNLSELFMLPTDIMDDTAENTGKIKSLMHKFNDAKSKFKNKYGDHIAILKIIEGYMDKSSFEKKKDFAYKYFLKTKTLDKAANYFDKMKYNIRNKLSNVEELSNVNEYELTDRIMASLCYGFKLHTAYFKRGNYDTPKIDNVKISRTSYINELGKMPNSIIYHELFNNNGRLELNITTSITDKVKDIVEKL